MGEWPHASPGPLKQACLRRSLAAFCPTCRNLLRPVKGTLVCAKCSQAGRARTVMSGGKAVHLQQGQQGLMGLGDGFGTTPGIEPTLTPQASTYQPADGGTPHPNLGLFPYDEIRAGQRRFARDATRAVASGTHLVAQAPTGIGKTAAALAPALQHAIDEGRTVLFLTSRQSQHRIAVDTLRSIRDRRGAHFGVVDLVAKRDMCLRPEANELHPARFPDFCARETRAAKAGKGGCSFVRDVDEDTLRRIRAGVFHVEELMQVAKEAHLCPHLVAMESATQAQVVVADYNHLFSDIRERSLERLGVDLHQLVVIVDEAHNLPDRIKQNHAHKISDFLLDQVEGEARAHRERGVVADVAALRKTLALLAREAREQGKAEVERLGDGKSQVARLEVDDLHRIFEATRNEGGLASVEGSGLHRTLSDVIKDLGPLATKQAKGTDVQVYAEQLAEALEDWGRFRRGGLRFLQWDDEGALTLHVRLLDPGLPARDVFGRVHAAILMSGTLEPPEMFRDLLGLDGDSTVVRTYPSPFPPENRLVVAATGYTTRFKERSEALWTRIATTIMDTCEATAGNVAVYCPSYAILREVRHALTGDTRVAGKEVVEEESGMGKAERDQVLDRLRGALGRGGGLLLGVMGGSFSEGVDFKDGLLSSVIIVGLPLAPPDLEVTATIGYLQERFPGKGQAYGYTYPAMQRVLQAMGRGIRSGTDRCAILLLDARYLQAPYRDVLPQGVIPSSDPAFTATGFLSAHDL